MALSLHTTAVLAVLTALVALTVQQQVNTVGNQAIPDALELSTITFDKVISRQNVTVVMFKRQLRYEPKRAEFAKFAESTGTQPEVIAATVEVIEEGDVQNLEIAQRFGITMDQLPLIKLFTGGKEAGTMKAADITCDNLTSFVIENTGLWIGRTGTSQYLDSLATEFMRAESRHERERVIDKARQFKAQNVTEDEQIKSAAYYIRVFEDYMKQGPTFMGMESGRLKALMAVHKSHEAKKCGIRKQQNILETFRRLYAHFPHDEL